MPAGSRDKGKERRKRETVRQQAEAEKREAARHTRRRGRVFGWLLVGSGALVFFTHLLEHFQVIRLMSQGAEDLLVGYPTAAALAIAGVILITK